MVWETGSGVWYKLNQAHSSKKCLWAKIKIQISCKEIFEHQISHEVEFQVSYNPIQNKHFLGISRANERGDTVQSIILVKPGACNLIGSYLDTN